MLTVSPQSSSTPAASNSAIYLCFNNLLGPMARSRRLQCKTADRLGLRKVAIGIRPRDAPGVSSGVGASQVPPACSRRARARRRPDRRGRARRSSTAHRSRLKSRNPRFGCPRIAGIVSHTFGVDIDKNVVARVLAKHYRPAPGGTGPPWLSFIGHTTDSLWSVDLFRWRVHRAPELLGARGEWTSSRGGSSASPCTAVRSTALICAACSTPPFRVGGTAPAQCRS